MPARQWSPATLPGGTTRPARGVRALPWRCSPGPCDLDSDRDPAGAARRAERRPGRRTTARARSRRPPVTQPVRRRAAAVPHRPPTAGGPHTSIAGPKGRWPTGARILRIVSFRDASEHSGSMRRTTRARRHGTPAERSSIPSSAGWTRTGSCPPPSASAARTTPGGRTSPSWPDSVRSNGGHVGVTRRSRSRIGHPAPRVSAPRATASGRGSRAWWRSMCPERSSADPDGWLAGPHAAHIPGFARRGHDGRQHRLPGRQPATESCRSVFCGERTSAHCEGLPLSSLRHRR